MPMARFVFPDPVSGSIKSVASDPVAEFLERDRVGWCIPANEAYLEEKGNAFLLTVHAAFTQVAECRRGIDL